MVEALLAIAHRLHGRLTQQSSAIRFSQMGMGLEIRPRSQTGSLCDFRGIEKRRLPWHVPWQCLSRPELSTASGMKVQVGEARHLYYAT
jgi:hypothetical protein